MKMKTVDFLDVKKYKFHPDDQNTNDVRLRELTDLAKYLPEWGHRMEFGVFNGTTISCLANARPDLDFVGFDSFEGLPENWDMGSKEVKAEAFDRKGEMPNVPKNVKLVKGWFDQTLPNTLKEYSKPLSFLHLDCDVYSSSAYVLETLNFRIVPGTIIRFDELSCWRYVFGEASPQGKANRVFYTTWKEHQWKAMQEWLEKHNRTVVPISRNWFQGATVVVTQ